MKKTITILLAIVSMCISCKKEDKVPPVINSVNIQAGDTLRNNFELKVDATDNTSISGIEVYANDSLIVKSDKAPLDYQLNTLKMNDGEYTIKIVVNDANGNKTESSCKVQIQNALLTYNLGDTNHSPFKLLISDEQGNILNSVTLQGNGKVKVMPLAAYDKDAINFVYFSTNYGFTAIIAYLHVKRGSEYGVYQNLVAPTVKGFKLHLKKDIGSFSEIRVSTDQASYQLLSMADTANLPSTIPYGANHKLLLQIKTDNGHFYKFLTIDDIQELTEYLSDINLNETVKTCSFPASGNASFLLQGTSNETDSINRYYISEAENAFYENHLDVFYPAEYFSKYVSGVLYTPVHSGNSYISYSNQYRGDIPDTFDPLSADFEIVNASADNFKANISGNFDLYYISYYDPTQTIELLVSAPVIQKEWKLPDLATAFGNTEFSFGNLKWNQVQIINMGSLDWSNKFYDLSVNFERLNFYEKYVQYEWIFNSETKNNKQMRLSGQDLIDDIRQRMRISGLNK